MPIGCAIGPKRVGLGIPFRLPVGYLVERELELWVKMPIFRSEVGLWAKPHGPGVPAAQLERIFDRYYAERRAEASNGAPESHFGIGLSIARRNVEAMGGTIEA